MTSEEIKKEALKNGFRLCRIPVYQCSCYVEYPNENHKCKNGKWKCVEKYRPIKHQVKGCHSPITKCVRRENNT